MSTIPFMPIEPPNPIEITPPLPPLRRAESARHQRRGRAALGCAKAVANDAGGQQGQIRGIGGGSAAGGEKIDEHKQHHKKHHLHHKKDDDEAVTEL